MNQVELAQKLHTSRVYAHQLIHRKTPISKLRADELEGITGIRAVLWRKGSRVALLVAWNEQKMRGKIEELTEQETAKLCSGDGLSCIAHGNGASRGV